MKKMANILRFFLAVLMMGASVALAGFDPVSDDTDIFLANPNITAERPNVLIVLDNTANWNTAFTNEKSALVQVVNGLTDQFNVGLMLFPETGGGNDSVDGGYVRYHVRQMTGQNKSALATMVNNLDQGNDKGNNATTGLALHEAYLYFAGKTSIASNGKVKTDKDGTTDPLLSPLTGHALAAGTSPSLYRSPIGDGCARSFIIYISNGPGNENASARSDLQSKLAALTGVNPPSSIAISPNGQQGNWADEMAKFMANADVFATSASVPNSSGVQNVYTYAVEVDPGTTGQGPDWTALMKSVATNGKGKYFAVSSNASGTAIVDALNQIFTEVQAVNSVFASTTLPVSVNVRGTNLNQVYIGVFRPDANKAPRWLGNLKMYNLALDSATNTVFLADAANSPPPHASPPPTGNPAENATTGFISQNSPSFWTSDSTFWGFRDSSLNGAGGASDRPDGDLVEKGGAAQQLRIAYAAAESATTPRALYTCTTGLVGGTAQDCQPSAGFALSNTPFQTTNAAISPAALQLDTHPISPLTAYATSTITNLTDRQDASLVNSFGGVGVSSLSNGGTTRTITNLTTATPKVVSTLTSDTAGTQTRTITSITKSGSIWTVQAAGALPSGYTNGVSVTFTGFSNTSWNNVTLAISNVSGTTFQVNPAGNPGAAATGNSSVPATVTSTTARATLPAHGFVSGQQVTIAGATPTSYNVSNVGITVTDADHFTYSMSSAPATTGNATGTITASGNTTTATATFAAAHGIANGSSVVISGASIAAYNGTKTISCTPAPTCTGATTFTYSVGTTAIGPNTANPVYAVTGGSTTVTVVPSTTHFFNNGDTVTIAGSDVGGYNGAFVINCPACNGAIGSTASFTYTTSSILPANTSTSVTANSGTSNFVILTTPFAHNFALNDFVVVEGSAPHAGTYRIIGINSTQILYDTGSALPPPSGTYTVRERDTNTAYATLTGHGYGSAGATKAVLISGATPTAYNTTDLVNLTTVTIDDANRFHYTISSAPGPNTSTVASASIKSTTARATSVNHGFTNGSTVAIAGATPAAFNGSFTIAVTNSDSFTYTIASAQGDASGTIAASQASGSSPERDQIIRWVRGEDNFSDENSSGTTSDIRASVHGDVLHSRPAVVNYNRFTGSDDDVFVFYGGNDGVFHAIKGGYRKPAADSSTLMPGQEAWGFVPQEFFGQFRRLRNNSPIISSSFKRPYFMDGPIGVYTKDANNNGALGDTGDVVNLYIANRRGGRFIYALDVNDPVNPKFLWKIDNTTTGFTELGQTWSQPLVITGLGGVSVPVLIFGAGYDPTVEDLDPAAVTSVNATTGAVTTASGTFSRTMGRGIYVVNALTGALIWSAGNTGSGATKEVAGMIYAIPSDLSVVRNESGGFVNRAYVGDTGGNMWRIDFKQDTSAGAITANPNNLGLTTVTKLASIADQSTAAGRRKFQFPPDVVAQSGFDAILIGSGDREHPFDTTITNRFYMFKDKGTDVAAVTGTTTCDPTILEGTIADPTDACAPNPGVIPGMSDLTSDCLQDASACLAGETQAAVQTKLGTDRGWFITLASGEKVIGNAVSIGGTTFFNTNQPSATAGGGTCGSNLGVARQYQVATADASATADLNAVGGLTGSDRSLIHAGGGYLPSPVHVVVMLDGKPVEAVISGVQVSTPAGATLSARLRKYWYREIDPK
jgi:Tfp pilus tip-associated adhesin PilY1